MGNPRDAPVFETQSPQNEISKLRIIFRKTRIHTTNILIILNSFSLNDKQKIKFCQQAHFYKNITIILEVK